MSETLPACIWPETLQGEWLSFFRHAVRTSGLAPDDNGKGNYIEVGTDRVWLLWHSSTYGTPLEMNIPDDDGVDIIPTTSSRHLTETLEHWRTAFRAALAEGAITNLRTIALLTIILDYKP